MSIVRVGMSEDPRFAEGYEAIFGKKDGKSKGSGRTNGSTTARAGASPTASKKAASKAASGTAKSGTAQNPKSTRSTPARKSGKK